MPVHSLLHRLLDAWQRRVLILKAASFATVGFVNSLIDFGVFWIAVQYFGVPLILANVLSWLVAITNSFVMNSLITFARESGGRLHLRAYARFAGVGVVGLVVNTTTLLVAVSLMPALIADPVHQLAAAKACAIAASFLVNFSLSNFVVFRRLGRDDSAG
jgi:putative flippase GtrA